MFSELYKLMKARKYKILFLDYKPGTMYTPGDLVIMKQAILIQYIMYNNNNNKLTNTHVQRMDRIYLLLSKPSSLDQTNK